MGTRASNREVVARVGLVCADQRHEIGLQAAGFKLSESFTVEQKTGGLQAWIVQLRARFRPGKIAWALEQTPGAMIYALMNYTFMLLYLLPRGLCLDRCQERTDRCQPAVGGSARAS